jgi:Tol biopolymer transport system component
LGSIAYHWTDLGINRSSIYNFLPNTITPLVVIGYSMDLELGTNAHLGEWSPDNLKFAYVYTRLLGWPQILRVDDFKAGTLTTLYTSESGGGLSSPTWSPDGKRLAFIRMLKKGEGWAIETVNADGTGLTEIRSSPNGEQYRGGVSWSKDNMLAFAQNLNGPSNILKMNPDGSGVVNLSTNPTADDSAPVWSPDGRLIAFTSNRDGLSQIYVMNADGSGLRRVSLGDAADLSPSWSPDANWIAFTSTRNNSVDVYIMDLHGDNVSRLTTTGGDYPMWSR